MCKSFMDSQPISIRRKFTRRGRQAAPATRQPPDERRPPLRIRMNFRFVLRCCGGESGGCFLAWRWQHTSRRRAPQANIGPRPLDAPQGKPMRFFLTTLVNDEPGSIKARVAALYALLLGFNLAAWCWAFVAFHRFPVLLGTAFLAYSFGLRHAVDADHIAAIDNVTRKLMQQGKRPVAVGLMFSLGHSTIVIVGSIAIAGAALALQHRIDGIREIGGVIGTLVSAIFLFGIAFVNLIVLQSVCSCF